jgi:hypothetical protein
MVGLREEAAMGVFESQAATNGTDEYSPSTVLGTTNTPPVTNSWQGTGVLSTTALQRPISGESTRILPDES